KRGLDEVVALNVPAERRPARKLGQTGGRGESHRADDGVVAPVVALRPMPRGQACRYSGAIDAGSELLQPLEDRAAAGEPRHRLDEPGARPVLHGDGKADQRLARHHTVCIQYDEAVVRTAEPLYPVGDIAGLLRGILQAPAVIDGDRAIEPVGQRRENLLLTQSRFEAAAVAQDENVEILRPAHFAQVHGHRLDGTCYSRAVLM